MVVLRLSVRGGACKETVEHVRQQLHTRFYQWLDALEERLQEPERPWPK